MSTYEDDAFDTYRDAAVQAQGEYERSATRECGCHGLYFPNESPIIERGGNGQVTTTICRACKAIVEAV